MHGEPRIEKNRSIRTSGIPFTRGPLAHLLRNHFYFGGVTFKDEILKQPAILDRDLFDAVQTKLSAQATNHKTTRMKPKALLAGRISDDRGNRMSPPYARKRGIKYRYGLPSALMQRAGSMRRAPAAEIEHMVLSSGSRPLQAIGPH